MSYIAKTPLATDSPKTSATQIQANFEAFANIFSVLSGGVYYNHIPLNDANQGKHGAVLFQRRTNDEGDVNNFSSLYAKNATSATSTEPQLFVKNPKFLPTKIDTTKANNDPMQLTFNQVNTGGPIYQTFLPGGYILYFGSTTTYATPIVLSPTPTKILCVQATSQVARNTITSNNLPYNATVKVTQPATIKINSENNPAPPANTLFLWMAIAKA